MYITTELNIHVDDPLENQRSHISRPMSPKLNASQTELIWLNCHLTPATDILRTVLNLGPGCFVKSVDVARDLSVLNNTLSKYPPKLNPVSSISDACGKLRKV